MTTYRLKHRTEGYYLAALGPELIRVKTASEAHAFDSAPEALLALLVSAEDFVSAFDVEPIAPEEPTDG